MNWPPINRTFLFEPVQQQSTFVAIVYLSLSVFALFAIMYFLYYLYQSFRVAYGNSKLKSVLGVGLLMIILLSIAVLSEFYRGILQPIPES